MITFGPSGVKFEMRKFRGLEIQAVADKIEDGKNMSSHAMCTLLKLSWVKTLDVGPYVGIDPNSPPNFYSDILKNDIPGLLLSLRVGAFRKGSDYTFKVRCEHCGEPITWRIDIAKHVLTRVKTLTPEGTEHLESGKLIQFEMFDKRFVGMRLTTLAHEEPMSDYLTKIRKRKERVSRATQLADRIATQVMEVNGEPLRGVAARLDFAQGLEMDDLYDIRDAIDGHEAEVDDTISVKCGACRWEFEATIPLGKDFLDPSIGSRRERLFGQLDEEPTATE